MFTLSENFSRLASLTLLVVAIYHVCRRQRRLKRLPPGPPGSFFAGNVADLPQEQSWKVYEDWAKTYGMLRLSSPIIITINSVAPPPFPPNTHY